MYFCTLVSNIWGQFFFGPVTFEIYWLPGSVASEAYCGGHIANVMWTSNLYIYIYMYIYIICNLYYAYLR